MATDRSKSAMLAKDLHARRKSRRRRNSALSRTDYSSASTIPRRTLK
jgi:hypothetical protein